MKALSVLARTTKAGDDDCDGTTCLTAYLTDDGRLIIQGDPADDVDGVELGPGERAVVVPAGLIERLARAAHA